MFVSVPGSAYTAEQLAEMGWSRGTKCEQDVLRVYDLCQTTLLPHALLKALLEQMGHAKSTVHRSLNRLLKHRCLKKVAECHVRLVSRRLPWVPLNVSRPGKAANRFEKGKIDAEREASFVRQYLADRLDKLFENPNAFLVDVLRAVEWAGRMATAAMANDPAGLREAVDYYRREWLLKQPNDVLRPLTAARLMEALQVGLFPEEFAEDEEVKQRIEEHLGEVKRLREKEIANAVAENEKITAENIVREKRGEDPEPLIDTADEWLSCKEFGVAGNGLLPKGGGERVGALRLKGFLIKVGAIKGKTEGEDVS